MRRDCELERDLALAWSGRWSLVTRILAVNIFALALLAGGFFYLDSYRSRLIDQRVEQSEIQATLIAEAIDAARLADRPALIKRLGTTTDLRIRVYDRDGTRQIDSWRLQRPTYRLRDPALEAWRRKVARFLDRAVDTVAGAEAPDDFAEPPVDSAAAWPEVGQALSTRTLNSRVRRAPDRTLVLSAAAPLPSRGAVLTTRNARDITRVVRQERLRLGVVLLAVIVTSVLLSLFLARTIARPLRRLAIAAQRVRLGRAREVQVPRLPSRRDEIGTLARALSDMTHALRQRIDATEAFAADVTHELKNPLASLRSAIDSLERVTAPELKEQLVAIVHDDVRRLDRLISDISEASRVDSELARARFELVDLGLLIERLVNAREVRSAENDVRIAFARPNRGTAVVLGDGARLTRVVENLVDNAVSFSPPGGLIQIAATRLGDRVLIWVDDEGPGVPVAVREDIFRRFHSIRPESETFGRHSGLGLAIAKAIVEGHQGSIEVRDRDNGAPGARFLIELPAAEL